MRATKTEVKKVSKSKLTLSDRILIPVSIPQQAGITTHIVLKDILKKISITQDEIKKFEIKNLPEGGVSYNSLGMRSVFEYDFTDLEKNELKLMYQKFSDDKKLESSQVELALQLGVK